MKLFLTFFLIIFFSSYGKTQNSQKFDYDNLNRLTKTTYPNGTIIKYTYDKLGNRESKVISSSGFTISGLAMYAKPSGGIALNGMQLQLKDSNGTVIQTVSTNSSGNYQFTNVSPGAYTISPGNAIPWSNVAVLAWDLYLYQKDIGGQTPLGSFYKLAGDVDMNNFVVAYDLYLIARRIGGSSNTFPSGDWLIENATITVSTSNLVKNLSLLMYGDADGSFNPSK